MWPAPQASAQGRCNWRFAASATRRQWRNCERCGSSGRGARWRTPDGTAVRSPLSRPRRASARSADSRPTTKPALANRRRKRCAGASPVEIGGPPWCFMRPATPTAPRSRQAASKGSSRLRHRVVGRERAVKPLCARIRMAAFARTPVLPEATPVGALSALDRDRGTPRDATPPTPPGIRVRTTAVRPS